MRAVLRVGTVLVSLGCVIGWRAREVAVTGIAKDAGDGTPTPIIEGWYQMVPGHLVCRSYDYLQRVTEFEHAGDQKAVQLMLADSRCSAFGVSTSVYYV